MPAPPLPPNVRELLAKPNPAVIATVREDGHPVTVPTWYLLDGDRIFVNMDARRKRMEHLRADPRVSRHYTGRPYPDRDSPRVNAWIEVGRWHGWGAARTT